MGHQVNLAPDAYQALRRAKREGETFSDVVRRLTLRSDARPAIVGAAMHADPQAELAMIEEERQLGAF